MGRDAADREARSSRSHALLTIDIHSESWTGGANGGEPVHKQGRIIFADLAGPLFLNFPYVPSGPEFALNAPAICFQDIREMPVEHLVRSRFVFIGEASRDLGMFFNSVLIRIFNGPDSRFLLTKE